MNILFPLNWIFRLHAFPTAPQLSVWAYNPLRRQIFRYGTYDPPADFFGYLPVGLGLFGKRGPPPFNAWQKIDDISDPTAWGKINTTQVRDESVTVA